MIQKFHSILHTVGLLQKSAHLQRVQHFAKASQVELNNVGT